MERRKKGIVLILIAILIFGVFAGVEFFGKKENISIHELADKGAEWGLFLSDNNTPLSAKTIEIELGEIWRGEHLQKVMEKKSKNKNKDKK